MSLTLALSPIVQPPSTTTSTISTISQDDWPTYKPTLVAVTVSGHEDTTTSGVEVAPTTVATVDVVVTLDESSSPLEPSEAVIAREIQVALTDELLKNRFSCRFFTSREVEREVIEQIIDVARFAPSGNNIQCVSIVFQRVAQMRVLMGRCG